MRMHGVEDAREVGGIKETGRAAAKINGIGGGALGYKAVGRGQAGGLMQGAPVRDLAFDGAGVGGIGRGRGDSRMEVAVGALGLAERHLDVDAEPLIHLRHVPAPRPFSLQLLIPGDFKSNKS